MAHVPSAGRYGGLGGRDAPERLTLDVDDRPTIGAGDVLLVTPDVGAPYRATVREIDADAGKVRVQIPPDPRAPHPVGSQRRTFYADDLEAWHAMGELLINPPERPTGGPY